MLINILFKIWLCTHLIFLIHYEFIYVTKTATQVLRSTEADYFESLFVNLVSCSDCSDADLVRKRNI